MWSPNQLRDSLGTRSSATLLAASFRSGSTHTRVCIRRPGMRQVIIACVNSSAPKEVAFVARTLTMARLRRQNAGQSLLPDRGRRKIGDVNRRDNELRVETLTRVRRNRMRALISPLLRLFDTLEWQFRNASPARDIERARGEAWYRVLSASELEALASARTDAVQRLPYAVAAVRFATLAGLRTGAILGVHWDHLRIDSGRLFVPASIEPPGARTTNLRQHSTSGAPIPPSTNGVLRAHETQGWPTATCAPCFRRRTVFPAFRTYGGTICGR